MIVITAGERYLDIDAYASGIAYAKLLSFFGEKAVFASSAQPNSSVCELVKSLGFDYEKNYQPKPNDKFIVLDLSAPEYFDKIVSLKNVIEVIDHHTGFENYWKTQPIKTQIEFIGSVATIIFERYKEANKLDLIDEKLAKLLISAILDNTLNLKSSITTERDKEAYETLQKFGGLDKNFDKAYFGSCEKDIKENIVYTIKNDIKEQTVSKLLPEIIGQVTIFNKEVVIEKLTEIQATMSVFEKPWMLNIICIKDGKSYIVCDDKVTQQKISKLFNKKFKDNVLILEKFLLRKQIIKFASEQKNQKTPSG